jgi:peptidoglycan DL-endopeptidase LytE
MITPCRRLLTLRFGPASSTSSKARPLPIGRQSQYQRVLATASLVAVTFLAGCTAADRPDISSPQIGAPAKFGIVDQASSSPATPEARPTPPSMFIIVPAGEINDEQAERLERQISARGERSPDDASVSATPESVPVGESEISAVMETANVTVSRRDVLTHGVVEGDTVLDLANRFGVSLATIVRANNLSDSDMLSLGQDLLILPVSGVLHTVVEGDTVMALAERYHVIPEEIIAVNDLDDEALIQPGQRLIIPLSPEAEEDAAMGRAPLAAPLTPISYRVQPGDTLRSIAAKFGVSAESISWANDFSDADVLSVDQEIIVPPVSGVLHEVAPGDNLIALAAHYGASATEMIRLNVLSEPYVLQPGQILVVADGRPVQRPVVAPPPIAAPAQSASRPAAPPPAPPPAPKPAASQPAPKPAAQQPAPKPAAKPATPATPAPRPQPVAAAPAAPTGPAGQRAVDIAHRFLGYRYVWGGTTPAGGFDCSGLVFYVFRQAGIPLPRDMWGQLQFGRRIDRANLQPGDIVFFENTYKKGMSHNGIYIGGNRFLHAASPGTGVIITGMDDPYWRVRYIGASRPGG